MKTGTYGPAGIFGGRALKTKVFTAGDDGFTTYSCSISYKLMLIFKLTQCAVLTGFITISHDFLAAVLCVFATARAVNLRTLFFTFWWAEDGECGTFKQALTTVLLTSVMTKQFLSPRRLPIMPLGGCRYPPR